MELPFDRVRGAVPDEFALAGFTGETAGVLYRVISCGRIVAGGFVLEDAHYFDVSAFVTPRNSSWNTQGVDRYLLDIRTDRDELTRYLSDAGLSTETASFEETVQPQDASYDLHLWAISNANSSFDFHYRTTGQMGSGGQGAIDLWMGVGPFVRAATLQDHDTDLETDGGTFQAAGTSVTQSVVGPAWPSVSQAYLRLVASWEIPVQMYS